MTTKPVGESSVKHETEKADTRKMTLPVLNKQAKDPTCGMVVDVVSAKYKSEHNGNSLYFCCAVCKQIFERHPEKYSSTV